MKVIPLNDRVLLKRIEEQQVNKGGIIIPDTERDKRQEAEVIAEGKGRISDEGKVILLNMKKGEIKKMDQDMGFNALTEKWEEM